MAKKAEVILTVKSDTRGVTETSHALTGLTQRIVRLQKQAEAAAKTAQAHAAAVAEISSRWRDTADVMNDTSEIIAGVGAGLTAALAGSTAAYVQALGRSEAVSRQWLTATERIQDSYQRVGRVTTTLVLPVLEQAADLAERAAQFAEQHPGAVQAVGTLGAILTAVGALGVIGARGLRLVMDARQLAAEVAAAKLQNDAADKQLAAAGIQSKSILARAGALATTSLIPGAKAAAQGTLAARMAMATGAAAPTAFGVPLTAAGGVTGASLLAAVSPLSILGGLGAGFLGHSALAKTQVGQNLGMKEDTSGQALSILAYGLGSLVGKGDEAFQAVGRWTGVLEKTTDAATETANAMTEANNSLAAQVGKETWAAAVDAYSQFEDANLQAFRDYEAQRQAAIDEFGAQRVAAEQRYESQRAAMIESFTTTQAAAIRSFQAEMARAAQDFSKSQAEQLAAFARQQAQAEADYYASRAAQAQAYSIQAQRAEQDHQRDMARMREDYLMNVQDAALNRDAIALRNLQRSHEVEQRRAEADYQTQAGRAGEDYAQSIAAQEAAYQAQRALREQEFARQQAEQVAQYEQLQAERQAAFEQEQQENALANAAALQDLETQHQDEQTALDTAQDATMAALSDQYHSERETRSQAFHDQLTLLDAALTGQQTLAKERYAAMEKDFAAYLERLQAQIYTSGTGSSGRTSTRGARAGGGYADYGQYTLGEGGREFVLNASTTRRLEQTSGGYLTQNSVFNHGGGVRINANFTGMGSNDRAWFETRLNEFSQELATVLA
jgi:hypothetical protein